MKYTVGVDVGGTNIRVALGDEEGRMLSRLIERTDKGSGPEGVGRQVIGMVRRLVGEGKIEKVGVGSAGPLNLEEGAIIHSPNIGFDYIPLVEPLKRALNVPVFLANDCVAGVLGEKCYGRGRTCRNLVYVTISSGIGGGAIVDDHLLLGKDGNAHEVGHLTIDAYGRLRCGCGGRGHWEAYCGGANAGNFIRLHMEARGRDEVEASLLYGASGGDFKRLSSRDLFEAAGKGDSISKEIVGEMGRLNAIGFANIANAYDPELITVGGAIPLANPSLIIPPIREQMGDYSINRVPEVEVTGLGGDTVLYGALALPKYFEKGRPNDGGGLR